MQLKLVDVTSRVLGAEHAITLANRSNLALALTRQEKYREAEPIQREVNRVQQRVLGPEHPQTLSTMQCLAGSLSGLGKYAEAEEIQRDVYRVRKARDTDHPSTMVSADNLGKYLTEQGKFAEGERIIRETYASAKRVLGAEHPQTLVTANNLASCLLAQAGPSKHLEAAELLQQVIAARRRILGAAHPETVAAISDLHSARCKIKAAQSTSNDSKAATRSAVCVLPAGTRVLMQGLVSKTEYNGKRSRVLSFDESTGRYVVALDDGKELRLRAECLARAGCALPGCSSEEASSVCGRCEAVRYCSRECQQADWTAHKPACARPKPKP